MTDFPQRGDNFDTVSSPGGSDLPARILREIMLEPEGLTTAELAFRLRLDADEIIGPAAELAAGGVLAFLPFPSRADWKLGPLVSAALSRRLAAARGVDLGDWIPAA